MFGKIFQYIKKHKILFIIILIIILGVSYFAYNKYKTNKEKNQTLYVISTIEKGTIVSSITGTGQVSDSNQIDLKPKVNGDLIYINMKSGQNIKQGDVLARIDSSDAQKTVRDAKSSLESAQLSLEKLQKSADALSLLQAQNTLDQAKENKSQASDNIEKAYEDAYNAISNAFLDFPTIMSGLDDVLYSNDIGKSEVSIGSSQDNLLALLNTLVTDDRDNLQTFQNKSISDYNTARIKYNANFNDYKNSTRYSDKATIESLLNETIETSKAISQAAKSENNYLDVWHDYRVQRNLEVFSKVSSYQTNLSSYLSETNNHLSTLLSIQSSLQNYKDTLVNSDRTIEEKTQALEDLKAGADPLDIKAQQLSITQKKNSLSDALEKLADYTIKAPFDGMIASVSAKKNDSVSSATSLATLVTGQKIAEVSLNEIDITKIKSDQKATLTFDAISDLTITGDVVEVDAIGTVSQGVVSYNVKISFDTDDDRIKPGMSVSAAIIIDSKQDVLVISSSAIKTKNGNKYVEVPNENVSTTDNQGIKLSSTPKQVSIETGIASDSMTEIISGINEGDFVITKTINSSSKSATNSSSSSNSSSNKNNDQFLFGSGGPMGR